MHVRQSIRRTESILSRRHGGSLMSYPLWDNFSIGFIYPRKPFYYSVSQNFVMSKSRGRINCARGIFLPCNDCSLQEAGVSDHTSTRLATISVLVINRNAIPLTSIPGCKSCARARHIINCDRYKEPSSIKPLISSLRSILHRHWV